MTMIVAALCLWTFATMVGRINTDVPMCGPSRGRRVLPEDYKTPLVRMSEAVAAMEVVPLMVAALPVAHMVLAGGLPQVGVVGPFQLFS